MLNHAHSVSPRCTTVHGVARVTDALPSSKIACMETKRCSKCGINKPSDSFYRNRHRKDGLNCYCKECMKVAQALSNEKHKDKRKVYRHSSYEKNKESENKNTREYLRTHEVPERTREHARAYSKKIREELRESYVVAKLRMDRAAITEDVVELKREQIRLHRSLLQLKQAIEGENE